MQKAFEKIVERLEEKSYDMEICEEQFDMNEPYFMDVPYEMVKMDDVKEIVKQVAEEYDEEVCEWKETQASKYYSVGCEDFRFFYKRGTETFRYCPYCGKKIKVVER